MYPDPRVAGFIEEHFVAVRVHVREQADSFKQLSKRFSAAWTPTMLVLDPSGVEHHRIEGFLPADEFLAQLTLGLAHAGFARGKYQDAERWYREVARKHPNSEAAPEALYWAGVSRYKATNDATALGESAATLSARYPASSWTKKASVWGRPATV